MYSTDVPLYWILDGHTPVQVEDPLVWGVFFENMANRRVAETYVGSVQVSTVFLGIDHGIKQGGPPVLFETMIFGGDEWGIAEEQDRYTSLDRAIAGHARAVAGVRERLGIPEPPPAPEPVVKPSLTAWERLGRDEDD